MPQGHLRRHAHGVGPRPQQAAHVRRSLQDPRQSTGRDSVVNRGGGRSVVAAAEV